MGKIRFLHDNLLDGASVLITPSSVTPAVITNVQKNGAGTGMVYAGGTYSGTTDRQYVVLILAGGEVGAATFVWSEDGGLTYTTVGVATSASEIVLSNGITARFTGASGTDFVAGDRCDFFVLALRGTSKLLDRDRNTEYRSAGVSVAVTLTIDLATAQAFQALILQDHNFTAGATITLAANPTDAWGAPAYGPVAVPWTVGTIAQYLAAAETYRYVRLSITDAGNPDGYLRMSNLFLGPYVELASNFGRGWSRGRTPYLSGATSGVHPTAVALGVAEVLSVQLPLLSAADRNTLVDTIYPACYSALDRTVRPLWVNPDSGTPSDMRLMTWDGDAIPVSPHAALWDLSLSFRERVRVLR